MTAIFSYSCWDHWHRECFIFRLSILVIFVDEMEMMKIIIKVLTNKLMFPYQRNTTIREIRIYD